jgi:hypothetical protein
VPRPAERTVTYVNSPGLGDPPSLARVGGPLATYPDICFKIDACFLWDRALIDQLAGRALLPHVRGEEGVDTSSGSEGFACVLRARPSSKQASHTGTARSTFGLYQLEGFSPMSRPAMSVTYPLGVNHGVITHE